LRIFTEIESSPYFYFRSSSVGWLLGWSLTSLFSTNTAISETKGQGWRVIFLPIEGRLAVVISWDFNCQIYCFHNLTGGRGLVKVRPIGGIRPRYRPMAADDSSLQRNFPQTIPDHGTAAAADSSLQCNFPITDQIYCSQ